MQKGYLPVVFVETIKESLLKKLIFSVALNPLGALLGSTYGQLGSNAETRDLMRNLVTEAVNVIDAETGIRLFKNGDDYLNSFLLDRLQKVGGHRSSMLQDIEAGRKTEIDHMCGAISRLGQKAQIATPITICLRLSSVRGSQSMTEATENLLFGHDEALRQAKESYDAGRMHHAWMLSGIEGIGKATLARAIASYVLNSVQNPSKRADIQVKLERAIAGDSHPDVLTLRRATDEKTGELKKLIVIDDALKVGAFLRRTATNGGWRVVLIDEANTLNRNAQNAILKILEEPPTNTLILMTVTTPGALLPTIRSRCRVLHLAPLTDDIMTRILEKAEPSLSGDAVQKLLSLSGGSVGFALQIVRSGALALYDELIAIVDDPGHATDMQRLHKLADQISRKADSESFEVVVTLLLEGVRQAIRDAALGRGKTGPTDAQRLLLRFDRLQTIFTTAEHSNLDRKLAFINAVTELRVA